MKRRLEILDLDSLRDLQRTRGWARIAERITFMRAQKVEQLIQPASELETAKLRGEISMCDVMLKVPSILIAESTSTRKVEGD